MRVAQVNESAHLKSLENLRPLTDQPTNHPHTRPPIAGGRAVGLDREVDWSTAPVKGNFDKFHKQWLTH